MNGQNGTHYIPNSNLTNMRNSPFSSPLVRRKQQQQQQHKLQHGDFSQNPSTPQMQRRESIVKPTWQNVCPGEVPYDTLEKLNQLSNGEQQTILLHQQVNLSENGILQAKK